MVGGYGRSSVLGGETIGIHKTHEEPLRLNDGPTYMLDFYIFPNMVEVGKVF